MVLPLHVGPIFGVDVIKVSHYDVIISLYDVTEVQWTTATHRCSTAQNTIWGTMNLSCLHQNKRIVCQRYVQFLSYRIPQNLRRLDARLRLPPIVYLK